MFIFFHSYLTSAPSSIGYFCKGLCLQSVQYIKRQHRGSGKRSGQIIYLGPLTIPIHVPGLFPNAQENIVVRVDYRSQTPRHVNGIDQLSDTMILAGNESSEDHAGRSKDAVLACSRKFRRDCATLYLLY